MKYNQCKFCLLFVFSFFSFFSFAKIAEVRNYKLVFKDSIKNENIVQNVIICSGKYAYAYHSRNTCPGLNNCQAKQYIVSEFDAKYNYDRKPCCRCWQKIDRNNCYDDNPNNIGGNSSTNANDSEAYAYVALFFVATGAILLSNEVNLSTSYSFYDPLAHGAFNPFWNENLAKKSSISWAIQFRKNFKNSGLEYGIGFAKYKYFEKSSPSNPVYKLDTYRFNFNYVHDFLVKKMPSKIKLFAGPSINYLNASEKIGIGGIVGSSYKLIDRVKIDLRYELTTNTHQVNLGLQFLYQKKYFWKKNR